MDIWTQYEKYQGDVIYRSDDQKLVKVCVGLSATFYFWHGETKETRLAVARCFERFEELLGSRLAWALPNEDISRREILMGGKRKIPALREYVEAMHPDDELDWRVSGGASADEASDCYIATLTTRQWQIKVRNPLSWLNFAMPVEVVYGPEGNAQLFIEFVRFCCEQLQPWHGIGGLASLLPQDLNKSQAGEFDLQQRYFGLDAVANGYLLRNSLQRHLKGSNWLTIFDKEYPATISREQWQTLDTTPGIQIWKAGRTYVLQAGEQPTLGPVPDGIPPLYKVVSDIIKPMRLAPMPCLHFGSATGAISFNERTSELWSQRFDAPGIWPPYPDQIEFNAVDTTVDEYAAQPGVTAAQQPRAELPRGTVLRALPGQPCPQEGEWFSPFVKERVHVKLGDPMPGPETTQQGAVTWYLRTE
ncbi:type VI immunity family protein [Ralstonia sp. 25C]|uniref:type VI immunity family protein n=1 Tax=Ralstonia sp. 25C TaxID=3447363 RepID=UPI003F7541DC